MRSPYIVAHRGKDLDEPLAAGLLEIERMNFPFVIGSFKLHVPGKGPVTAELFRSFQSNFWQAGEDVELEDLENGLSAIPGGRMPSGIFPDLVLAIGDGDIVSLRGGHLLAIKAI